MSRLTKTDISMAIEILKHPNWGDESDIRKAVADAIEAIQELQHYKALEEQGRLIELKQGRWIYKHDEEGNTGNAQYECSECGAGDLHAKSQDVPYCWKCGAKMVKGTEE